MSARRPVHPSPTLRRAPGPPSARREGSEETGTERWAALAIHSDDDVAVALRDLAAGETVAARRGARVVSVIVREAIPMGHKIALRAIPSGAPVRKYGQPIGAATADIASGAHVHVHNVASGRARAKA